jgi:hypothetical protein
MMKHYAFSANSCVLCVYLTVRSPFRSNHVFTVSDVLHVLLVWTVPFFFMKIVQDVEGPLGIILGLMQLVVNLGMMKLA